MALAHPLPQHASWDISGSGKTPQNKPCRSTLSSQTQEGIYDLSTRYTRSPSCKSFFFFWEDVNPTVQATPPNTSRLWFSLGATVAINQYLSGRRKKPDMLPPSLWWIARVLLMWVYTAAVMLDDTLSWSPRHVSLLPTVRSLGVWSHTYTTNFESRGKKKWTPFRMWGSPRVLLLL